MASLHEKLDKIKSPKLQNQHHTGVVLSAVEDTLRDQNAEFTATAYFAALLALLPQSINTTQGIVNKELATSVVYLLDTVSAFVPAPLLRSKFAQILGSLVPALTLAEVEAPLLKSSVGCLQNLLIAQDSAAWALPASEVGPRRAIAGMLALAVDHRPKVRKRVQDALIQILRQPPPSPSLDHPAADLCAETALRTLNDSVTAALKAQGRKGKHQQDHQQPHEPAVSHALQLVKAIAAASGGWPSRKIEPLCELLMNVARSSNEYLTMGTFEVFEVIFTGMADEFSSSKLPRLLEAISELKPAHNDSQLLPPWIAVLSRGYDVSAQVSAQETFEKLPELFNLFASFLTSPSRNIRTSASEGMISLLVACVPESVLLEASVYDEKIIEKLAKSATGLLAVKYQVARSEVFNVLEAMFNALQWKSSPVMNEVVKIIGDLRANENFQGKKEAEKVLGAAINVMGPKAVLDIIPLNIVNQKAGQPGRVWLLPILRDHVANTSLAYFRSELVPLSEALYQRVMDYGEAEKTVEVKIFETLVQQTWACLPGFCELPLDMREAFDQPFAELLSNVLYKQAELRVDVCKALQNLVESNQAITSVESEIEDLVLQRRVTREEAKKNIEHLSGFAGNMLAVLFNVYSQTLPQFRGYILQCINAYLSITGEQELIDTFGRVTSMLEGALEEEANTSSKPGMARKDKMPPTSHTLMDLIVTMSIYLPRNSFATLFSLASVVLNKSSADPQLIKKAYKLIPRLAGTDAGRTALSERSTELQSLILSTADKTPAPAHRDRLLAIHEIITHLPTEDLHFIPGILSEVVLGCKESNEKARTAAFALLVHTTERMIDSERNPPGTKIRNSLVAHMPDDAPDAPATIEEMFTMVSAGLAGSSPHMVAASVTAMSRLLFEYHSQLPTTMQSDLLQTIELFLTSNNREIVRSVLGFVKVAVVALPDDLLKPRLPSAVPKLMMWSKEHKGRLRSKVKGILDRLIRKFGAAFVEGLVEESDRKLVVSIRKERERQKRKKEAKHDEDDEDTQQQHPRGQQSAQAGQGKSFNNEFDKAVYGSDSDYMSGDESDASEIEIDSAGNTTKRAISSKGKGQSKRRTGGGTGDTGEQYIRELSPESNPLDLLAPDALANISSTKPSVRFLASKHKQKHRPRMDEDGKLLLGDHGDEMDTSAGAGGAGSGVNAYLTAVSGPDALRKGQKGRLRASQGKKGDDDMDMDMEMDVDDHDEKSNPARGQGQAGAGAGRGKDKGLAAKSGRRGLGMGKERGSPGGSGRIEKRRRDSRGGGRGRVGR
ncbi:ribosomal RNA-processing protein 12 [Nannizzia gypsea CBS 118893]|uniref:Ribosomal RNA-processing protein 12 n=1 Tax=Arthroderma gypseum (strain ATCC MYA-4604 / CBS 118893) TaxID=535722 RepID=E4UMW9_ARTGP|nr:90S preribosome component RRP12 [Nannizzia gypsea CBS 118893]EFQ99483.1 ribosomal RNA-processing protein 12 [Nannizzia gypsea CBS 118893]